MVKIDPAVRFFKAEIRGREVLAANFMPVHWQKALSNTRQSKIHSTRISDWLISIKSMFDDASVVELNRPCRLVVRSSRCGQPIREDGGSNPPWDNFLLRNTSLTSKTIIPKLEVHPGQLSDTAL